MKRIYIVGFPRSGTTMLASELSKIQGVVGTPESHIFQSMRELSVLVRFFPRSDKLKWRLYEHSRLRDMFLPDDFKELINLHSGNDLRSFSTEVIEAYARKINKDAVCVVEKTPAHLLCLEEIYAADPDSIVVHIVRDPRDAIISIKKTPWGKRYFITYCMDWHFRVDKYQRLSPRFKKAIQIKYEDFTENPTEQFELLKSALGFEALVVGEPSGGVVPDWELAWKKPASYGVYGGNTGKWQRELSSKLKLLSDVSMGAMLSQFGYGPAPRFSSVSRTLLVVYKFYYYPREFSKKIILLGMYVFGAAGKSLRDVGSERS